MLMLFSYGSYERGVGRPLDLAGMLTSNSSRATRSVEHTVGTSCCAHTPRVVTSSAGVNAVADGEATSESATAMQVEAQLLYEWGVANAWGRMRTFYMHPDVHRALRDHPGGVHAGLWGNNLTVRVWPNGSTTVSGNDACSICAARALAGAPGAVCAARCAAHDAQALSDIGLYRTRAQHAHRMMPCDKRCFCLPSAFPPSLPAMHALSSASRGRLLHRMSRSECEAAAAADGDSFSASLAPSCILAVVESTDIRDSINIVRKPGQEWCAHIFQ